MLNVNLKAQVLSELGILLQMGITWYNFVFFIELFKTAVLKLLFIPSAVVHKRGFC